jgi:hypothetical protein
MGRLSPRLGRLALSAAVVGALAGCGSAGSLGTSSSSASDGSGATGQLRIVATIGPTCPVQRVDASPCIAPYVGELTVLDSSGKVVARVTTSAAGIVEMALPASTYTVDAPEAKTRLPRLIQPVTVTVPAGGSATAMVTFDTGIR